MPLCSSDLEMPVDSEAIRLILVRYYVCTVIFSLVDTRELIFCRFKLPR